MSEQINMSLRELLLGQFNEEELTQLCADLGMNYAALPGEGAFGKTRAMLMAAQGNNKLYTLIAKVRELRPDAYAESALPGLLADMPAAAASTVSSTTSTTQRVTSAQPDAPPPQTDAAPKRDLRKIITLIAAIGLALLVCMLLGDGLLGLLNRASTSPADQPGGLPTLAPNITPAPLATAIPPTAATSTPAPAQPPAQPVASSPAAQRVIDLNNQLIQYYQGQVKSDVLTEYWTTQGVKEPIAFFETTLPRVMQTGKPVAPGAVAASVKYVNGPTASAESATGATVNTRETWKYTNTSTGQVGCETRDYVYTFVDDSGKLKVSDVAGKQVSAGCTE